MQRSRSKKEVFIYNLPSPLLAKEGNYQVQIFTGTGRKSDTEVGVTLQL